MANPEELVDSTTVCGSVAATSTGNVTLISSAASAIYVYAMSLGVVSTARFSIRLMSGSTTAECWRWSVEGASSAIAGARDLAVSPPAYLFRTNAGDPLTYEKGNSSVSGAIQDFSFAFWRQ